MLTHDYGLKQAELQQISSADAVVGLFTALGYDTSQRIVQVPAAMGFPEPLAREVVRMERVADHEAGALQVYLVEFKHLRVAEIQQIGRVLKTRGGSFMFVLTTRDYDEIDFVLYEKKEPEYKGNRLASPQVVVRPRILSVNRRNPDPVSLRVLRRFSYTEIDPYYQWDKLLSAYGVAEWSEPLFNNRALFSDYYLKDRLTKREEWNEDGYSARQGIEKLLLDVREKFSRADEAKVRVELLEPIFKALGWKFEHNKHAKDDSKKADYNLITSNGKKIPCLAYVWDRSLDGMDEQRDQDTPTENPAQSVVSILEESQDAKWAIVTNGKTWRLYAAQGQVNSYYEMDLEETLASIESGIAFRYFWLMFRAKAFSEEPSFVDSLLTESASYAKALGERLKDKVFDDVFPQFAEGFVKSWGKPAAQLTDEELDTIFRATLTFLYRMLFLLYAEARDLLPVKEARGYFEISLTRMKKEIAEKSGEIDDEVYEKIKKAYSASETGLYDRLSELFAVIDKGRGELNVPVYNGGLFITFSGKTLRFAQSDMEEADEIRVAQFLSSHKIPDRYLAFGLDLLARNIDDKTLALVMIDYKSLGVRQLGSIYEGLLEFKVRVAREKMAVVAGKKGDAIVPYAEAEKLGSKIRMVGRGSAREEFIYKKGEVYLDNDKHERKASGSFYTPDYIVKYIVQNTVGPALEARFEALRPKLREAERAYHEARKRQEGFEKIGQKGDDPEKTAYTYRALVTDLFDLRVLDPAMGSGHFLVETVDFITRRLLDFLNAFPWNPVRAALRQTRENILEEMQKQGVSIDPARLTDINLLKRFVLKRCIYGVDLNPMAVELAKVSLWLDCFTLGAPLSFLDHHLRCGNSLIGTNVKTVEAIRLTKTGQHTLFAGPFAGLLDLTSLMVEVVERSDATVSDIHSSAEQFGQFRKSLEPYKEVLDLWTSQYFNNPRANEFVTLFGDQVMPALKGEMKVAKEFKEAIANARVSAKEKRFFHWDLEFPEIFVDLYKRDWRENPGFDAVVGNPPWVDVQDISVEIKNYLRSNYTSAVGKCDLYALFVERGVALTKIHGLFSMIIQSKFLVTEYGLGLRSYLAENADLKTLVHFADAPLFGAITVYPLILTSQRRTDETKSDVTVIQFPAKTSPEEVEHVITSESRLARFTTKIQDARFRVSDAWQIDLPDFLGNDGRLRNNCVSFGEIGTISYGIKTNADEIYLSDWDTWKKRGVEKRLLRPAIKPRDFDRYIISEEHAIMLFPYNDNSDGLELINLDDYPGAKKYFASHKEALSARRFYGKTIIEQGMKWYELPYVSSYSKEAKLAFPTIANRANFALDISGEALFIAPCYVVHFDAKFDKAFMIAILNSKLVDVIIRARSTDLASGYMEMQRQYVEAVPIRQIIFTTPVERRNFLVDGVKSSINTNNLNTILLLVDTCLQAMPEESDVVHDLLAYLAEQMIKLNKQKQGEMKRFLNWLEGVLKVSVDEVSGKSKLRNYIGDYQKDESEVSFEEVEEILYKNRGKLGISVSDERVMAKIRGEYEKSLAVLRSLKASLRWTDGVIDQVVYRLYGLTEEEIKIVEGEK